MVFTVTSRFRFLAVLFMLLLFCSSDPLLFAQSTAGRPERYPLMPDAQVRNIILFIGDGMGLGHLSASRINTQGGKGWYTIECMPVTSIVRTNSADDLVTDSAAGATAYATGYKTNNGMLSVSPDSVRLKTIVEAAREKGMATGLITMGDPITGATPAAFAVHVPHRSMNIEIASQLAASGVDILIGRGENYFLPETTHVVRKEIRSAVDAEKQRGNVPAYALDTIRGARKDGRNVVEEMKRRGYAVVRSVPELEAAQGRKILGFMAPETHSDDKILSATRKALQVLSKNRNGFFLMVECPVPDHGGHSHDSTAIVASIQQFDRAVKAALEFARKDRHTLVLVTADHETGGLSLLGRGREASSVKTAFSTGSHTAIPVPLFAFGPHAMRFTGMKDNTEVAALCGELLRFRGFPAKR